METDNAATPAWRTAREAIAVVLLRAHLRKTMSVAGVVGTLLFAINHLDSVIHGETTARMWLKVALTYLVPFAVANYGILVATRQRGR